MLTQDINILVDNEEVYQKYCFVLLVKIFFPNRDNIIPKDLNDLREFLENLPLDKVLEKETVKNIRNHLIDSIKNQSYSGYINQSVINLLQNDKLVVQVIYKTNCS